MFTAKGEIHYGLAPRLRQKPTHPCFAAILTGYPYETVPNKPMLRGKTYGGRDEAEAATLNTDAPQPATLSASALGAPVCPSGGARTLWLRHPQFADFIEPIIAQNRRS
jgi:hypothetical protein